ncbi:Hexokinase-like 3 [Dorcoceras hygrometricum]|uniref:Phosphotransferase n=1 Tax=Dorcoceras hygrometricum TaxID=472368 RepID=A0A2Z7DD98_9LAMI|nr:Hexokinase-like 3 [Dorcoceras hygrometricum]
MVCCSFSDLQPQTQFEGTGSISGETPPMLKSGREVVSNIDEYKLRMEEKGTYYGINLRGTDFLMLRAKLNGKNEPVSDLQRQEVQIRSSLMADANSSKVGRELRDQINKSLEDNNLNMQVFALVGDTIGNLAGGRYYSKESVAAVTLGMATDVSYIESPQQASKLLAQSPPDSSETVVNMQWGNYKSSHLPLTEFDASLDAESTNPGHRIFEKLISGMYLGEIVRRVLLKMARESALFGDSVPPKLAIPYLLKSPDMAAMHQDTSEDYEVVNEKLKEVFEVLYYICFIPSFHEILFDKGIAKIYIYIYIYTNEGELYSEEGIQFQMKLEIICGHVTHHVTHLMSHFIDDISPTWRFD